MLNSHDTIGIAELNRKYRKLKARERIKEIFTDFKPNDIMLTSSFAATSVLMLKLFSDVQPDQPVFFIDTGYHFKETLEYKEKLTRLFNLNVISVKAGKADHQLTAEKQSWKTHPEYCCLVNKVHPLDLIKKDYKVWVSGLMEWQSDHRSTLDIFEERGGILKFHPVLNISRKERDQMIKQINLPAHPLVAKGYHSIGCSHCTVPGMDRNGRWSDRLKTECGLHL